MTRRLPHVLFAAIIFVLIGTCGWFGYRQWLAGRPKSAGETTKKPVAVGTLPVKLTPQARKNMGLVVEPIKLDTYSRKIELPGTVTDRPGISDRGVVAPVGGVITQIHIQPGQTIPRSGALFTLRLVSNELHTSQRELFKASDEITITKEKRERLAELAKDGGIPKARMIEIDNDIRRLEATIAAYEQDLQSRGLSQEQIAAAARGKFLKEITVTAPDESEMAEVAPVALTSQGDSEPDKATFRFEIQDLKVELGQQVETGEVLCVLADHRSLLIEGHGFAEDLPLVQRAAQEELPIEVEFETAEGKDWPPLPAEMRIHHVANTIDPDSRTFAFYLVLENQWRAYFHDGQPRLLWRFRPGNRVRMRVTVEKMEKVFILPQAAVVREGPEAYVFRQNGDLFDRRPVRVVAEDRESVVIANDGSLRRGFFIAQNGAASLNRVLKAQSSSGLPAGVHVHADGTVHAAH